MIEIKNLSKTFETKGDNVQVLKNVNLNIKDGSIFGVIGISGAGKSTLLRILAGLETPTTGSVKIDGHNIANHVKDVEFRKKIGFITQSYALLMQRTVLQNVMFPLIIHGVSKIEAKEKSLALLKIVGLEEKVDVYPVKLSGGQKQRVAIARALAVNPPVLLCDEPTSALDSMTTNQILKLLKTINKTYNITIIMITHNMNVVAECCDHVAVIDNAEIIEVGNIDQIINNPKQLITKKLLGHLYKGDDINE